MIHTFKKWQHPRVVVKRMNLPEINVSSVTHCAGQHLSGGDVPFLKTIIIAPDVMFPQISCHKSMLD